MSDYNKLAERVIACGPWRWLAGMQTTCGIRVTDGGNGWLSGQLSGPTTRGGGWIGTKSEGYLPDLSDPATAGCLLALVFELEGKRVWPNTAAINLAVYGPTHLQTIESLVSALEV